jgi:hypothetical protein
MNKKIKLIGISMLILVILSGCYGNFPLTRKVYNWNGEMGDKYMNNIVFWVLNIIPVYGVASLADAVIFNLIEFWTGENPMAMEAGAEVIQYAEIEGVNYQFKMTKNCMEITPLSGINSGESFTLEYNEMIGTWHLNANGKRHQIAKMGKDKIDLLYPDGRVVQKSLIVH